jgi:hypothetical protein
VPVCRSANAETAGGIGYIDGFCKKQEKAREEQTFCQNGYDIKKPLADLCIIYKLNV